MGCLFGLILVSSGWFDPALVYLIWYVPIHFKYTVWGNCCGLAGMREHELGRQVIRKIRRKKPVCGRKATDEEKKGWQTRFRQFMRCQKPTSTQKMPPTMPNYVCVRAMDKALQLGVDKGLAYFRSRKRPVTLTFAHKRFYVSAQDLPAAQTVYKQRRRSCIENTTTGKRQLEIVQGPHPTLHTCTDCGSEGLPDLSGCLQWEASVVR